MQKTTKQQLIEARNPGKNIREVIEDIMKSRQGQRLLVTRTAVDMDISDATLYQWCRDLGIDIEGYQRPKEDISEKKRRTTAGNPA